MRGNRLVALLAVLTAVCDDRPPDPTVGGPQSRVVYELDTYFRALETGLAAQDLAVAQADGFQAHFLSEIWRRNCLVQSFVMTVANDPLTLIGVDFVGDPINLGQTFIADTNHNWNELYDVRATPFPAPSEGKGVDFFFALSVVGGGIQRQGATRTDSLNYDTNINISRVWHQDTLGSAEYQTPAHELGHSLGLGPYPGDTLNLMYPFTRESRDTLYGFEPGAATPTENSQCWLARRYGKKWNFFHQFTFSEPI